MHHKAWLEYCNSVHVPPKLNTLPFPAKNALLTLVAKYKTETDILPTHKKIFIKCRHYNTQSGALKNYNDSSVQLVRLFNVINYIKNSKYVPKLIPTILSYSIPISTFLSNL